MKKLETKGFWDRFDIQHYIIVVKTRAGMHSETIHPYNKREDKNELLSYIGWKAKRFDKWFTSRWGWLFTNGNKSLKEGGHDV